ncbi:MAG: PAS domain-containing protein [Erythrobacter sp.]
MDRRQGVSLAATKDHALKLLDTPPWPTGHSPAPEYCSEVDRLRALASFDLGGLEGDDELARLARFAARLCNAPSAAVSLVEAERQRFLAGEGLDVTETPRSTSFCAHTMLGNSLLEVLDATQDERFAAFDLVQGKSNVRYYVGAPLISSEGAPMGALCVTDTVPHKDGLDALQIEGLTVLADAVKRRLESHRQSHFAVRELKEGAERLQFMLDSVPDIAWSAGPGMKFDNFNARWHDFTGKPPPQSDADWRAVIHPDDFEPSVKKLVASTKRAEMFEDEWRMRMADGSYRWMLSRAVPSGDDPATAQWFGTVTDIHDRYSFSQERELLAGELAHRIKNIFSVIIGLINLRAKGDDATREFGQLMSDNIRALARAQDYALPIEGAKSEELIELLKVLMTPYGAGDTDVVSITGDKTPFGPRAATPLALVFHELATNSAKYGALSVDSGRVEITVLATGKLITIGWHETGGPTISQPEQTGFGTRLMRMAIDHQLGGNMTQNWQASGLEVALEIPADKLTK